MFKSDKLFVIASRGDRAARTSYNPKSNNGLKKMSYPLGESGDNGAFQLVCYTLEQLIEINFNGKATIVTHDDIAIRGFEYRKAVREKADVIGTLAKEWMSEEQLILVVKFCDAMTMLSSMGAEINFVKLKNVHCWELRVDHEFVPVTAENHSLVGQSLYFVNGIYDNFVAQIPLTGTYKITARTEKVNGNYVKCLALERPANNLKMIALREAERAAWELCPIKLDFDSIEESIAV